ncbi:Small G protein signaling modulator 1, partial [Ophiophagus hannah]
MLLRLFLLDLYFCYKEINIGFSGQQYYNREITNPDTFFDKVSPDGAGMVEICLLHMLKRRASGFLRTDKIAALFTKVGKTYDVASEICRKVQELLQQVEGSKYYEREALLADPVFGPILACLLVGPCALDYTKLKTADHFWTDPSADELVQRHRIHGTHSRQDSPSKRPALGKDDMEAIPGYLSLHQSSESLTLKWTPNQLMNGNLGDSELEKSIYWDYALIVPFSQIVCIHCHQQPDQGGTLVLVSQDGIQRPPLHFPPGGHLLAFLSCLENGLLPRGQLEPPLWSQQGKTATDYVFRIIYPGHRHENITINYHHLAASRSASVDDDEEEEDKLHAMLSMICNRNLTDSKRMKDINDSTEMQGYGAGFFSWQLDHYSQGSLTPLKLLCESMKRQIVSRAFYGWLAYCRHLSTVRTHLSALVNHSIIPPDKPTSAAEGLTKENYKELELLRRVYYGGVQHDIRKEVWPFLLGHYKFGMNKKEMELVDGDIVRRYQKVMSEWKACEVVVFISVDEMDSVDRDLKAHEEPSLTKVCLDAPTVVVAVDQQQSVEFDSPDSGLPSSRNYSVTSGILSSIDDGQSICFEDGTEEETGPELQRPDLDHVSPIKGLARSGCAMEERTCSQTDSKTAAEESISIEMLDTVALNLHRIDKDVQRCDRNYWYFTAENLEKLRNIMCSYVWEHLEVGYVQG